MWKWSHILSHIFRGHFLIATIKIKRIAKYLQVIFFEEMLIYFEQEIPQCFISFNRYSQVYDQNII